MKTLISTLFIAGTFFLNSCGDDQEAQENKEDETKVNKEDTAKTIEIKNIGEALDYSLKFTALEAYKQGKELDSLNTYYGLLDKKSDTIVDFWKKKGL